MLDVNFLFSSAVLTIVRPLPAALRSAGLSSLAGVAAVLMCVSPLLHRRQVHSLTPSDIGDLIFSLSRGLLRDGRLGLP